MDTANAISTSPSVVAPAKDPKMDSEQIAMADESYDRAIGSVTDFEKQKTAEGEAHFRRLGWKRLAVILIVEAIGLGVFSLPGAFATLGLIAGVFCCVSLGFLAIYTGYLVGQVKIVYPHISHYGDIGGLLFGRWGEEVVGVMYVLQLILMTSSYVLTGTIAFEVLTDEGTCGLVFGVVSAILLFALAIMPSFTEAAILGYVDLVSVMTAIGITIIATGIEATNSPGGVAAGTWSAWPDPEATFKDGMVAICNMMFAYSFAMFLTPFMAEMHTPEDFMKSVWTLGILEMVVYTVTGALIFVFVGVGVESPALLSMSPLLSKIAFGIALAVIFISGAIGNTVTARYVHLRLYRDSVVRFINTAKGWVTWILVLAAITIAAWIIGEAIPFFDDLLALSSALFVSGFVLYLPALMWFMLLRQGKWYIKNNLPHAILCFLTFLFGLLVLVGGTYSSIVDIQYHYDAGKVRKPFSC
ncbi:hypothetical protein FZEAL_8338 [Fusarium zealandicum]|uniref:Amino acid transporter transmembrane domain-containing protein n=1 Tax=Fusarium zealandicum TaxID=1053134 RepID=A0A8H4XGX1_9HYPO|nr:hypothetical protein FZEAL_8338 [Fusarium zealandicum]